MSKPIIVEKQSREVMTAGIQQLIHELGETGREWTTWRRYKRDARCVLLGIFIGLVLCIIIQAVRIVFF